MFPAHLLMNFSIHCERIWRSRGLYALLLWRWSYWNIFSYFVAFVHTAWGAATRSFMALHMLSRGYLVDDEAKRSSKIFCPRQIEGLMIVAEVWIEPLTFMWQIKSNLLSHKKLLSRQPTLLVLHQIEEPGSKTKTFFFFFSKFVHPWDTEIQNMRISFFFSFNSHHMVILQRRLCNKS